MEASIDSDLDENPNPFPFDRLPIDVQSRILGLLPITTLVVCKAVSRSWRSIIRSPVFTASYHPSPDPIFLLYYSRFPTGSAHAYLPSSDRWIHFNFRSSQPHSYFPIAGSSLLLGEFNTHYYIFDLFSSPNPVHFLPPVSNPYHWHKPLALIQDKESPSDYKILVVTPGDHLHSQIFNSHSARWEPCPGLRPGFSSADSGVYLDGLLYCFFWYPCHLVTFDLVSRQWTVLDLAMPLPSSLCDHMFVFGGEIYFAGAVMERCTIIRIGIWKLDRSAMTWSEYVFMPDEYLVEFIARRLQRVFVVDCMGIICFYSLKPVKLLMFDMTVRRWWRPQPPGVPEDERMSLGHAIQPYVGLLLK